MEQSEDARVTAVADAVRLAQERAEVAKLLQRTEEWLQTAGNVSIVMQGRDSADDPTADNTGWIALAGVIGPLHAEALTAECRKLVERHLAELSRRWLAGLGTDVPPVTVPPITDVDDIPF